MKKITNANSVSNFLPRILLSNKYIEMNSDSANKAPLPTSNTFKIIDITIFRQLLSLRERYINFII